MIKKPKVKAKAKAKPQKPMINLKAVVKTDPIPKVVKLAPTLVPPPPLKSEEKVE